MSHAQIAELILVFWISMALIGAVGIIVFLIDLFKDKR